MNEFPAPIPNLVRSAIPFATALIAVFIDATPIYSVGPTATAPVVLLITVFYWSTLYPELIGIGSFFILGLLSDLISGQPLGLTSLSILLAFGLLWPRRRLLNGHGFLMRWGCFWLVCFMILSLRWLIACLWWGHLFDLDFVMAEILLTVALYPPVAWLLAQVQPELSKVPLASRG